MEEVLTDFWFNHFNIFEGKDRVRAMLASYERDAIRPHVLGKFKDLLLATARHPAMLYYLDNWQSMSPDVFQIGPFAPGPFVPAQQLARQAHGLNENYGRELLELHTLGVNGGYTQQDVIAVARCFTGWTIRQPNQKPEFTFAAFMHDTAEKKVLGHVIPAGGGEQDGLQVIEILARHPSTARFISTKLARRFVSDDPPQALIEHMVRTYTKTDGDLRAVLEAMFTSREFFSEGARQSKVKSPLEMVVSAARALDAHPTDAFTLAAKDCRHGRAPLWQGSAQRIQRHPRDLAQHRRRDGACRVRQRSGEWADSRGTRGQFAIRRERCGRHFPRTAPSRSLRANTGGDRTGSAGPAAGSGTDRGTGHQFARISEEIKEC